MPLIFDRDKRRSFPMPHLNPHLVKLDPTQSEMVIIRDWYIEPRRIMQIQGAG